MLQQFHSLLELEKGDPILSAFGFFVDLSSDRPLFSSLFDPKKTIPKVQHWTNQKKENPLNAKTKTLPSPKEGNKVGFAIRSFRLKNKLSQRALSEKLNLSHQFIGDIERGRSPLPEDKIQPLSEALNFHHDILTKALVEDQLHELELRQTPLLKRLEYLDLKWDTEYFQDSLTTNYKPKSRIPELEPGQNPTQ